MMTEHVSLGLLVVLGILVNLYGGYPKNWIPAFAGMTLLCSSFPSCPPFDFAQDRLRRASRTYYYCG